MSVRSVPRIGSVDDGQPFLKVAHVGRYASDTTDGVSIAMTRLIEALATRGVMSEVWELADAPEISRRIEEGVEIYRLPSNGGPGRLYRLASATRRFLEEERDVDLLHFHSVFIPGNVWLARAAGLPYVVSPHGGYMGGVLRGRNRALKALWMRLEEKRYVERARAIHAVSEKEAEELRKLFSTSAVECIPNGVEAAEPVLGVVPTRLGPRKLLFLGRLAVRHKGLDLLLEGFASFVNHGGVAHLVLAGPDFRGGRAVLEELARRLGISDRIEFAGPVYDGAKDRLLQESFALVHPSRWDGMPLTVLEALGAGCPPLITPETNLADEVDRYGAGVVVRADAGSIAEGIDKLVSLSGEDYELMRKRGVELVRERFTWASAAAQMSRLYATVSSPLPVTETRVPAVAS